MMIRIKALGADTTFALAATASSVRLLPEVERTPRLTTAPRWGLPS